MRRTLLFLVWSVWLDASLGLAGGESDPAAALFSRTNVSELKIVLDEKALASLREHPRAYVWGSVQADGALDAEVRIRLKGNYGTFQQVEAFRRRVESLIASQAAVGVDHQHDVLDALQARVHNRYLLLKSSLPNLNQRSVECRPGVHIGLTNWIATVGQRQPITERHPDDLMDDQPHVRPLAENGGTSFDWEQWLRLSKGRYRISATVTAENAHFDGPTSLPTMRVVGGSDQTLETTVRAKRHADLVTQIVIPSGKAELVLIKVHGESERSDAAFVMTSPYLERLPE